MGVVSIYLVGFISDAFYANLEQRLQEEAGLLSAGVSHLMLQPIDLEGLDRTARRTSEIIDARVTVLDLNGGVLADSGDALASGEAFADRPEFRWAANVGASEVTRRNPRTGEDTLYVGARVEAGGLPVGIVITEVPVSRAQSSVNRIIATIILAALIVACLSVSLGFYLARRTSRSVKSVAEGARRLARGDLDHRVRALSMDETQDLAAAFNGMAASLREMVGDLSAERNKLSAVLDVMRDGVIVVEANGEIALMNEAAGELLDASMSRVTGSRLIEVVRDHELQQLIARALATGEPIQGEVELLHRRRFLSATAVPLSQGPQGGVLLTLHDLTSIRQAETTRKEFVSNVSHEMRSPLASVKAMVETLEGGAIDDRDVAQDFLRRVHRDVNRMTTMVNDLLHLSRLESGQAELRPTAVDLAAVLEEAASQFRLQAAAMDVGLISDFPLALPMVRAEEEKLLQVLVNLLENALKFTPSGETITLWARDAGDRVEIGVSDTGVGIPREHLPHVFERFYKVDRARRDSGAGLGLAIVKHIVHAYGGEVGVRSEEGVGSTFTFTVPHASREA